MSGEIVTGKKYFHLDVSEILPEHKVEVFKDNIISSLSNLTTVGQITQENLNGVMELLNHENVIVCPLPIFRYKGRTMSFGESPNSTTYERGLYKVITVEEIKNYLDQDYLVFIYSFEDGEYEDKNNLKFRTIVKTK